jgi:hypothetical protein
VERELALAAPTLRCADPSGRRRLNTAGSTRGISTVADELAPAGHQGVGVDLHVPSLSEQRRVAG